MKRILTLTALAVAVAACEPATEPVAPDRAAQVNTMMHPIVRLSGPSSADADDGFITITATPTPDHSYYYEWETSYCVNEPNQSDVCWNEFYDSGSGQDKTTESFFMQDYYYYALFRVTIRYFSDSGVLAESDVFRVDGPGEEKPECTDPICPEGTGTAVGS